MKKNLTPLLAGGALLALGACATPLEQCLSRAQTDLRVVDRLIAESELTLARGYGLEERTNVSEQLRFCAQADGSVAACYVPIATRRSEPVAVDLEAEARKLASLKQKRAELAERAAAQAASCRATYPAE